ncbi:osmolarity sensor protein EnvZ [Pleomorphomonas sp. SM30]|uniref:histidine kinase n=2 Tax=Oharaeibacter diazotrophicus TaxID=1920512 RepID=A0A4R6R9H0_9HYPH|nr:ATP-binding protein [Oharaeibacter diazotrophicus]TDP82629.1 signal transduction histidine kinase [Oharaeibacter diazotrophicus]BBE72607.1 osmolarity sensor protein EnvZ [Pleomorphomonas sp. SM30]GLS76641.1 two-component sensor histidine kinase [Oharaeibacter diazotrophicus]
MAGPSHDPDDDGGEAGVGTGVVGRALDRGDRCARALRRAVARVMPRPVLRSWRALAGAMGQVLPKSLLGRSLMIVVTPMLVLLSVLTFVFMDRHWALVTARLSSAVVRDIAAVVDLVEHQPPGTDVAAILRVAANRLDLSVEVLPASAFAPAPRTGGLLGSTLSSEMRSRLGRPFSLAIDEATTTIEIRVPIDRGTLRVTFPRNLAYAANWHFFLVWMGVVGVVLIVLSIIFIRNQVKPIQRLANAAEAFGKGRPIGAFSPQGAREVRRAALAFLEMRRRIERQIDQRTTMLAGVSHDLRTVLTRFRLELALLGEGEDVEPMRRDVDEMEAMLEAYLAFARGDLDEAAVPTDVAAVIADVAARQPEGRRVEASFSGDPVVTVRPGAFRRLVGNLVGNAVRYGHGKVAVAAEHRGGWLKVVVDDDGPGIPAEEREAVFRPFYRLDRARNQDAPGTGLGLTIARDVARAHGGDVTLAASPLGGLRCVARLPG